MAKSFSCILTNKVRRTFVKMAKLVDTVLALLLTAQALPAQGTTTDALDVVQAATPPRNTFGDYSYKQTLVEYDFVNSYGAPFIGYYRPPPDNCSFTTTIFNLSVLSQGQQYDRLAELFLGDVEIWRTSTAMPISNGIQWSFQKDVSVFDVLLRREQKIILDLGNVFDGDLYTGTYNLTLEALYFNDSYSKGFHPAHHIYPISNLTSAQNKVPVFSLPGDSGSVTLSSLPRNIKTAVVSLMASGNSAEEFWYTNVPSEYVDTFDDDDDGSVYGYSSFREVQLSIDGQLAGVSWPFPILFTGGVDPGLWRPVVGINTYDLPSFDIDMTPWLSLLCDGGEHTFAIQVVAFDSRAPGQVGTVGQNWWVTGTLFVWLGETTDQTIAGPVTSDISAPVFDYLPQLGTSAAGSSNGSVTTNESLWVSLSAHRSLSVSSTVTEGNQSKSVRWTQELSFSNIMNYTKGGWDMVLAMNSSGSSATMSSFADNRSTSYSYPMSLYYSYVLAETNADLSSVYSLIDRSLWREGPDALPYLSGVALGPSSVQTRQNVTSKYYWNETIVGGIESVDTCRGQTWFSSSASPGSESGVAAYSRYLLEEDDALVADEEAWATMPVPATQPLPSVNGGSPSL